MENCRQYLYNTAEDMAKSLCDLFVNEYKKAVAKGRFFYAAISGGNTPSLFFSYLSKLPEHQIEWEKVKVFWVDERFVPHDSEFSNYFQAAKWLQPLFNKHPKSFIPIDTNFNAIETAANQYQSKILSAFNITDDSLPSFDLIFLGMGPDGHTASIFPESLLLHQSKGIIETTASPASVSPKVPRITFSLPLINNAKKNSYSYQWRKKD